jgi:hypothetical protein
MNAAFGLQVASLLCRVRHALWHCLRCAVHARGIAGGCGERYWQPVRSSMLLSRRMASC